MSPGSKARSLGCIAGSLGRKAVSLGSKDGSKGATSRAVMYGFNHVRFNDTKLKKFDLGFNDPWIQ